jgi:hypothetical protein
MIPFSQALKHMCEGAQAAGGKENQAIPPFSGSGKKIKQFPLSGGRGYNESSCPFQTAGGMEGNLHTQGCTKHSPTNSGKKISIKPKTITLPFR